MQETEIPVVILVASLQFQKHNFIKFLNYLTRNKLSPDTMNVIQKVFPSKETSLHLNEKWSYFRFSFENNFHW